MLLAILLTAQAGSAAAADELPRRIAIATWNLEWFFDHDRGDNRSELAKQMAAPSRAAWQERLRATARVIADMQPTILALQEIENRDVAFQLCQELERQHQLKYRIAFIPGTDFFTEQQVGLLYQSGLVEFSRREQSQEMFASDTFANIQKHIFATFEWGSGDELQRLKLVNVHFKATPESREVRQKQARLIRHWLAKPLAAGESVVVLGDFNAEDALGEEAPASEMEILCRPTAEAVPLQDLLQFLSGPRRVTHVSGHSFDRILVSPDLLVDLPRQPDLVFTTVRNYRESVVRGTPDRDLQQNLYQLPVADRDASDHYPILAEFVVQ